MVTVGKKEGKKRRGNEREKGLKMKRTSGEVKRMHKNESGRRTVNDGMAMINGGREEGEGGGEGRGGRGTPL